MTLISQYLCVGLAGCVALGGCASAPSATTAATGTSPSAAAASTIIRIVAIERVYGDLARQLGGPRVDVTTILNSPTADPHAYEPTARDADAVAAADIVIENGLGYDAFAEKLLAASPRAGRTVLNAGALGGHHTGDNPHVWYEPRSLRKFSGALFSELARRDAADRRAATRRHDGIDAWIGRYASRLEALGRRHPRARVAITEPVFDYVLRAAHIAIATPPSFSHAIEEGNDPAPQDVETMRALLANRRVAALVYNRQTVEPSTTRLLDVAHAAGVTVVPITETLPAGEGLQHWMDRELNTLDSAL
ncbi:MAG: metal ABC transporter solute-binding protein [Vulcanimicrobiaceae bacterium]